jgi:hypothetical protein
MAAPDPAGGKEDSMVPKHLTPAAAILAAFLALAAAPLCAAAPSEVSSTLDPNGVAAPVSSTIDPDGVAAPVSGTIDPNGVAAPVSGMIDPNG